MEAFRLWLRFAAASSGIAQLGCDFTPHSGRAGFASEGRLQGLSFIELREAGRWLSDSTLRIYIDTVEASAIAVKVRTNGLSPAVRYALAHWLLYFPVRSLLEHGSGRLDQATKRRLDHGRWRVPGCGSAAEGGGGEGVHPGFL